MLWIPRNPFGKWHHLFQSYSIVGKTISLYETFFAGIVMNFVGNKRIAMKKECDFHVIKISGEFSLKKKIFKNPRVFPVTEKLLLNRKLLKM